LYLGDTAYRTHGANDPSTIGKQASSGCIRLRNDDVVDLYDRAKPGATLSCCPEGTSRKLRVVQKCPSRSAIVLAIASGHVRAFAANSGAGRAHTLEYNSSNPFNGHILIVPKRELIQHAIEPSVFL
jgi:hypothetical protein